MVDDEERNEINSMKRSSSTKILDAVNVPDVQSKMGPAKRPLLRKEMETERQGMIAEFDALSMRSRSEMMNRHKMKAQKASKSKMDFQSKNHDETAGVIVQNESDSMDKSTEKKHDGSLLTALFVLSFSPSFPLNERTVR